MRKTLLTIAVALMAIVTNAQTWTTPAVWNASIDAVTEGEQPAYLHCSVDADGSVYATGSYNKDFSFANQSIANADQLTSAYVAKYKADGTEEWVATLFGGVSINAITTDAEGNAYVAGTFQDEVELTGANGEKKTINSPLSISAYVAKISKAGVVEAVKTFTSETNADILSIVGDPWDMGFDMPIYDMSFNDPVYVRPIKLQADGDKVYMSVRFVGDIAELGWQGAYQNMFDMMIFDLRSFGILSLNAKDLSGATSIANVQPTGRVLYTDEGNNPESLTFTVANDEVYAAFTGFNDITLATAGGTEDFTMPAHSVVVAKIGGASKLFSVQGHEKFLVTDAVNAMAIEKGKLYIGGSFYDQLPFNNEIVAKGTDLYVAALNTTDFGVAWTAVTGYEEEDSIQQREVFGNLVVNSGKVYFDGVAESNDGKTLLAALAYNVTADGTMSEVKDATVYASICDNGNGTTAAMTTAGALSVFTSPASGVQTVKTAVKADDKVYNLNGQQVTTPSKGLYIMNGKKVLF